MTLTGIIKEIVDVQNYILVLTDSDCSAIAINNFEGFVPDQEGPENTEKLDLLRRGKVEMPLWRGDKVDITFVGDELPKITNVHLSQEDLRYPFKMVA